MAHHWEIDPIKLVPTIPVRPQIIPSRDGARLSAWQAETFLHRTPVFKFGLAAAILGPTMARIDAGLADPNSQIYENLMQAGSYWGNQMPRGLSEISAETIRWLTKTASIAISLDQRTGPVPIATAEAINAFISTVLLFGGGIVSGIRQWFDTYDKRLVKGDVPVSPLYPVKRVVFAHPAIAENYADTHASREPMYGSIYVNPRKSNKNSDEPSCVIPKFPYGYRTRIDELDERVPGKRHAWCRHIGLDRAGTVVALPQKPGRELFGSLEKRMLQPYHVVAMLDEMDGLQEGFWKGKTLELGFPPLFHYESSYKDPIAEVVGLGRSYGANVVDISPERNFVAEMQAIATRRAREIDPENTEGAIGVLPVGRVNNEELKRMAEQLQRDETHPEGSVTVDIVSPSSSGSTTLGFDVLVLHGRDDEVVRDFATSFQGVHTNARATMVPVFRDIAEEQRMAQKLGIPAYTIAYESD